MIGPDEGDYGGNRGIGQPPGPGGGKYPPSGVTPRTTPSTGKTLACAGGVCKYTDAATPEAIAACKGKNAGDPCTVAVGPSPPVSECPEGSGKAYEGCPCGEAYGTKTGNCAPGYFFVKRDPWEGQKDGVSYSEGLIGTCHCQKAVDDWKANKKGQEFKWSPEMQALLSRILERANMLLDQPLGLSDEEREAIYSRIYEKIKGGERPAIQSQMDVISRQGMLGSPYAERSITGIQRGTRELLGSAERDIELEETQRRYDQLMGTTGMVQSLFGTGMGAEQIAEMLSSGRRGEGQAAMNSLLSYLGMLYGGQNNSYWQAILARLLQQQA